VLEPLNLEQVINRVIKRHSREKARKPHNLLWGGMASGGLGAAAPIMAFSLESPLDKSHGQGHEIK